MRFLAADFETSGLVSSRHAPVSLGVALMEDDQVIDSTEWLFSPPLDRDGQICREYDLKAMEINGHDRDDLAIIGKDHKTVMAELTTWAAGHKARALKVVAFNAPFDYAFYSECLFFAGAWDNSSRSFKVHKAPLVGPWQCARMIASVEIDLPNFKLDTVAAHFGLARTSETHGAKEDAILAGQVYARLLAQRKVAA